MLARLGQVLYWVGWIIGGPAAILGAYLVFIATKPEGTLAGSIIAGCGVAVWLIGRACKYVLTGE